LNIVSELQLSLNKKNKVNPTNSFNINKREWVRASVSV
jgi:hypothetical protein